MRALIRYALALLISAALGWSGGALADGQSVAERMSGGAPWAYQGSAADLDFANSRAAVNHSFAQLSSLITGSGGTIGGSPATVQNADGSISYMAAPRIGRGMGLLVEQQSTNINKYANNFSFWNSSGSPTLAASTISGPDGLNVFTHVIRSTTTACYTGVSGASLSASFAASTVYSASFWFSPGAVGGFIAARIQSVFPNRVDVTINTATLSNVTTVNGFASPTVTTTRYENGLTRVTITTTSDATGGGGGFFVSPVDAASTQIDGTTTNANDDVYVGYIQVEQGVPTSYMPTNGVSVTRSADIDQLQGAALTAALLPTLSIRVVTNLANITAPNARIVAFGATGALAFNTSNQIQFPGVSGSPNATLGSGSSASLVRSVVSGTPASVSLVANGGTLTTWATGTSGLTGPVYLGDNNTGIRDLNGYISRLTIWPYALPSSLMSLYSSQ